MLRANCARTLVNQMAAKSPASVSMTPVNGSGPGWALAAARLRVWFFTAPITKKVGARRNAKEYSGGRNPTLREAANQSAVSNEEKPETQPSGRVLRL